MFKKTVKYTDFNGVEREEDLYFHLSKPEILELEYGKEGGWTEYTRRIAKAHDIHSLIEIFKDILKLSYGVKSDDGRRFIKSEEVWNEFSQTEAFAQVYMELVSDVDKQIEFMKGILPADLRDETVKQMESMKSDGSNVVGIS